MKWTTWIVVSLLAASTGTGCHRSVVRSADSQVYRLIEDRQRASLGSTSNVDLKDALSPIAPNQSAVDSVGRIYSFTPQPLTTDMPEAFRGRTDRGDEEQASGDTKPESEAAPQSSDGSDDQSPAAPPAEDSDASVPPFNLRNALAYAVRHARRLQNSKEDLYLAALDLTLERHLWTPQFVASVTSDFDDAERESEFDQTLSTISDVSLTQRLRYGGELTARVIHSLVRDLNERATLGESAQMILEGNIPLLRGAGHTAYESRYVAERELIYAVRTFERFRRSFAVEVAAAYFNLQQLKTEIGNTRTSFENRLVDWEKAEFIERMGRSRDVFEAPRAKSILRQAEADLVQAKQRYESALDRFKILMGMPVTDALDVLDQDSDLESKKLDELLVDVNIDQAVEVAMSYRLDLLTSADSLDDTRRGLVIAKNAILPDLDFSGQLTANSDPQRRSTTTISSERTSWRAGLRFRIDDRKTERNAYRAAMIDLRRAQRAHEEFEDTVRADVRRALRRIREQTDIRRIQALNVVENGLRLDAARAQFDLGKRTNQDVVDTENELLTARNNFARAVASYRISILEFRRDTGTLRVTDKGQWQTRTAGEGP